LSNLYSVEHYVQHALELLRSHGIPGNWQVIFVPGMGQRLGTCNSSRRVIRISQTHFEGSPHEQILDTVRHEVAHAIVRGAAFRCDAARKCATHTSAEGSTHCRTRDHSSLRSRSQAPETSVVLRSIAGASDPGWGPDDLWSPHLSSLGDQAHSIHWNPSRQRSHLFNSSRTVNQSSTDPRTQLAAQPAERPLEDGNRRQSKLRWDRSPNKTDHLVC
jgi:hypothetical protein